MSYSKSVHFSRHDSRFRVKKRSLMKRPSPTLLARKTSKDSLIGLYRYMRKDYMLYLMILPGIVYILIFKYWPMYGISIAFRDFSIFKGYADAPWVGLRNFVNLFGKAGFIRALKNNIIISLLKLIMGFPTPIILSLMINELSKMRLAAPSGKKRPPRCTRQKILNDQPFVTL